MTECKGCLTKCTHHRAYKAGFISGTVITKCPCTICVIKMVCNDRCKDFDIYIKTELRILEEL